MSSSPALATAGGTTICALVHRLYAQSPPLVRLLFLGQTLGSALALVVLAFGMLQICTRQPVQLPIASLLLMLNLFVALVFANVGALLSALYHLHVPLLRPPSTHCYWLSFSLIDCLMIRTILNVSLLATYLAGAGLAVERMAGSLLLIRRTETKRAIAVFLAILQWLLSVFAAIPPGLSSSSPSSLSPHCSLFTPSPTQLRPMFFAILGIQAFVLAVYSILTYHNHFDSQVARELARHNPVVLEQVHATEQSLPAAATVVGLFLASSFLDRNFLLALAQAFGRDGGGGGGADEMFKRAFWSEFQILAIPLMSLLLVAILQVQIRSQRIAEEEIYERVGSQSAAAANVIAVRKVPSVIGGGGGAVDGMGAEEEEEHPYEKSSPSTSSTTSSSEGGRRGRGGEGRKSEEDDEGGKEEKAKKAKGAVEMLPAKNQSKLK